MSGSGPEIVKALVAACREGAERAADLLGESLATTVQIEPGEAETLDRDALPAEWQGAGLAIAWKLEGSAALLLLPESVGLKFSADADSNEVERYRELAKQLGDFLLPAEMAVQTTVCGHALDLSVAAQRASLMAGAVRIPMRVRVDGGGEGLASVVWNVLQPDDILREEADASGDEEADPAATTRGPADEPVAAAPADEPDEDQLIQQRLQCLPGYARSLLKIKVPVAVTLASTKQPLSRILSLVPGSILQFDKSCDETLSLEVGSHEVALGEAVKVGENFGLRVTSIVMPHERFLAIKGRRAS